MESVGPGFLNQVPTLYRPSQSEQVLYLLMYLWSLEGSFIVEGQRRWGRRGLGEFRV